MKIAVEMARLYGALDRFLQMDRGDQETERAIIWDTQTLLVRMAITLDQLGVVEMDQLKEP